MNTTSVVEIHIADVADMRHLLLKWRQYGSPRKAPVPADYALLRRDKNPPTCLVAKVGDLIVGFVTYRQMGRQIVLADLAVMPAYRRQGVGLALVSGVIEKLSHQCRTVMVYVPESYTHTQMLFSKAGFRAVEIVKKKPTTYYKMTWHTDRPVCIKNRLAAYFSI